MKTLVLLAVMVSLTIELPAYAADPEAAKPDDSVLRVGQAQVVFSTLGDSNRLDLKKFPDELRGAYTKALEGYGAGTPKMILIMTTMPIGQGKMIKFVHDKLGRGAPLYGVGTGSYGTIGYGGFCESKKPGITVLALGGDIEIQPAMVKGYVMPVKDWDITDEAVRTVEKAKHAEWGKQLAKQVKPVEGKTNVFFQMGTQHVPRMAWTHKGVIAVLGQDVYVVGAAASDFGYIWFNGEAIPNALLGVMVSGDFKVAMVGSGPVENDKTAESFQQKLTALKKEIGGTPDLTLYFGCVGWCKQLDEQKKVADALLKGAPLFGCFAGGEIGRYETDGKPLSDAGQLMLLGFANKAPKKPVE